MVGEHISAKLLVLLKRLLESHTDGSNSDEPWGGSNEDSTNVAAMGSRLQADLCQSGAPGLENRAMADFFKNGGCT